MKRPKKERTLPELINKKEVVRLINGCKMLKHKTILAILYATGVRSSKLCNIKIQDIDSQDIDSERLQIKIVKGD